MRKYIKNRHSLFFGALLSSFISSLFAVVLQFFKSKPLDGSKCRMRMSDCWI